MPLQNGNGISEEGLEELASVLAAAGQGGALGEDIYTRRCAHTFCSVLSLMLQYVVTNPASCLLSPFQNGNGISEEGLEELSSILAAAGQGGALGEMDDNDADASEDEDDDEDNGDGNDAGDGDSDSGYASDAESAAEEPAAATEADGDASVDALADALGGVKV